MYMRGLEGAGAEENVPAVVQGALEQSPDQAEQVDEEGGEDGGVLDAAVAEDAADDRQEHAQRAQPEGKPVEAERPEVAGAAEQEEHQSGRRGGKTEQGAPMDQG